MASRDQISKKNTKPSFSCKSSFLFLSLLCFVTVFLVFSVLRGSTKKNSLEEDLHHNVEFEEKSNSCDYTEGSWIYDPTRSKRYDQTCKEIFKGWNCISSNKSNAHEIVNWHWQPKSCDLPQFNPVRFLERFKNTNIGFVGDSLNRNMFVSLICTLKQVAKEVKKWRPAGADRGFTFLHYNLTVAYHRTNLLARYGRWSANANGGELESLGYKQGFRVDVDVPDGTWAEATSFHDVIILNTGHWWWAPSKFDPVNSPMLFFERDLPVIPPIPPDVGLDMVLRNMILFVERRT